MSGFTVSNPDALPTVGGSRLYMYYRVEQQAAYTTFSAANKNTTWININDSTNGLTSGNYYDKTQVLDGKNTALGYGASFSGSSYTVNGLLPSFNVGSGEGIYIYLRLGIPMNVDVNFTHVTASLT